MPRYLTCRYVAFGTSNMCLRQTVDGQHCDQHKEHTVPLKRGRPFKVPVVVKVEQTPFVNCMVKGSGAFEDWNEKPIYPKKVWHTDTPYVGDKIWP